MQDYIDDLMDSHIALARISDPDRVLLSTEDIIRHLINHERKSTSIV